MCKRVLNNVQFRVMGSVYALLSNAKKLFCGSCEIVGKGVSRTYAWRRPPHPPQRCHVVEPAVSPRPRAFSFQSRLMVSRRELENQPPLPLPLNKTSDRRALREWKCACNRRYAAADRCAAPIEFGPLRDIPPARPPPHRQIIGRATPQAVQVLPPKAQPSLLALRIAASNSWTITIRRQMPALGAQVRQRDLCRPIHRSHCEYRQLRR